MGLFSAYLDEPSAMDLVGKFLRFAGVGAIGTAAHYTVLVSLVQGWAAPPWLASSCGFLVGALVNYQLNYRYTFRSRQRHREAMSKFMLVALAGFLLNGALMVGGAALHLNYLLNQILATGAVLLVGFASNLLWTFRGDSDGRDNA